MTERLPEEPPPSPESFGTIYKLLAGSEVYRQISAEVCGPDYGTLGAFAPPADVRVLGVRAALAPGQWVADLGSGMGGPTLLLAREHGCYMVAVDWSRQAMQICRRSAEAAGLAGRMRYVAGDFSRPL